MNSLEGYFEDKFLLEKTNPGQESPLIKGVLVDADALAALSKRDDSNHQKAVKINASLQKMGVAFCLSPFTVAEAATVLSYRVSHQAAKRFLREIRKISLPVLELPEKYAHLADKWFFGQTKKGSACFDCYNMALLERYKADLEAIFSFDKIYLRNGFKLAEWK